MILHLESFNARGDADELETFLREKALPYWRKPRFRGKAYTTQYGLGDTQSWLTTEMEEMGGLDDRAEMNSGEAEGAEIMDGLLRLIRDTRAHVVREID